MRLSVPPMQRSPSPNPIGIPSTAEPCRKALEEVGSSPVEVSTTVSGLTVPLAVSRAPPVAAELSHPRPVAPVFAHGQGALHSPPSPKQKGNSQVGQTV